MKSAFAVVATLLLISCGKPQPPAPPPEPELAALARLILSDGAEGVIPEDVCKSLRVRVCNSPTVKTLVVTWGDQAKFAQVYLKSPENLSLGIRRDDDATVFLTDESGILQSGVRLGLNGFPMRFGQDEKLVAFQQEKTFWLSWLADHRREVNAPAGSAK
jgi:hypothetical protein